MSESFLRFSIAEQPWLRETIEALVARESPSGDRAAVEQCGAALVRRLEACGARVSRLAGGDRGDHIRAEFDGDGRPVLILGHFDTVWEVGTLAAMPMREEAGRLYGPGVFDMKSGIAVAMQALRILRHHSAAHPPVAMLWTTDEEIGSGTSRAFIEQEAR